MRCLPSFLVCLGIFFVLFIPVNSFTQNAPVKSEPLRFDNPNDISTDYWLVKMTPAGSKIWDKTPGGDDGEAISSVFQTPDGGYLLIGNSLSDISGDKTLPGKGNPPNIITTGPLPSNAFCAGGQLSINYSASGVYNETNTFLAQLSNAAGSFAAPINIGIITSNNLSGAIDATIPINTLAGIGYRIRVISSNLAAIGSDNGTNITINQPPSITINDISVCESGNLTLSPAPVANANYTWKGPNNFEAFTQQININDIKSSQAGVYKLSITVDGCSSTKDVTVTVNPQPLAVAGNSQSICRGNGYAVFLGVATPVSGNMYSWTSKPAGFSANTSNVAVLPDSTTTYIVMETNSRGCSKTNQATITVKPTPEIPYITPKISNATLCKGDSLLLTASGTDEHQWYLYRGSYYGETNATLIVKSSGVYYVRVTKDGCSAFSDDVVTVKVNPVPETPTITVSGNVLTSSSPTNNQWLFNGVAISNATQHTYTALSSGNYTVRVTQNGCQATSAAYNFTVTGIVDPVAWNGEVKIFPNPVVQTLFISNDGNRKLNCRLIDVLGRKVKETNLFYRSGSIDMNGPGGGVYYLLVTDNIKKESIRMTVIKQ